LVYLTESNEHTYNLREKAEQSDMDNNIKLNISITSRNKKKEEENTC